MSGQAQPMSASEPKDRVLDLPEMAVASLDAAAVERFFTELAFETTVLGILLRRADTDADGASGAAPNLRHARDAILSGRASGVQLRYVHAGVEWWATVMRTDAGFRAVRVRKPGER